MSDHGFGGVSNTVRLPELLACESSSMLQFRGGVARSGCSRRLDALKLPRPSRCCPTSMQKFLSRFARTPLGGIEATRFAYGIINWSQTKAFFEENPYYPRAANQSERPSAAGNSRTRRGVREPFAPT